MSEARLTHSRSGALFRPILTGYMSYLTIRRVFHHGAQHSAWLFPQFPFLPHWTLYAFNLFFYAYIVGLCIAFLKAGGGKERVFVAGWATALLLGLVQPFVSIEASISIQYAKGLAMGAALLMSLLIASRSSRPQKLAEVTEPRRFKDVSCLVPHPCHPRESAVAFISSRM